MQKYKTILFDLDGTLSDSAIGITTSFSVAMAHFGVQLDPADLRHLIGPPLLDSFSEYLEKYVEGGSAHLAEAIKIYRDRYNQIGKFENALYDGIEDMLKSLKNAGYSLGLATSKARIYAIDIMKHFGIAKYFDVMDGANLDGTHQRKCDVIESALSSLGVTDKSTAILVGDTHYDMEGAKLAGVDAFGVLWGYSSYEILSSYSPVYIAKEVSEITDFFVKR